LYLRILIASIKGEFTRVLRVMVAISLLVLGNGITSVMRMVVICMEQNSPSSLTPILEDATATRRLIVDPLGVFLAKPPSTVQQKVMGLYLQLPTYSHQSRKRNGER